MVEPLKPTVIRRTEAERREFQRILTTAERRAAPGKEERARRAAEAKAAIAQRELEMKIEAAREKGVEFERKLGMLEPTRGPVAPTQSIFQAPRPGTAILQATANRYQQRALTSIVQRAQLQGITRAKDVQISGLSQKAFQATQQFARITRKGAPILQEKVSVVSPTTGKIIRYPIESVVRGAEMAGMLPGGIEVMARRPEVIVPAVAVGVAQVAAMPAAFRADPKQFISDIVTLGVLFKAPAAIKAVKPTVKPVTAKVYAQSVKLMVDDLAAIGYKPYKITVKAPPKVDLSKASFERIFNQAIKTAQKEAKRDLTATEKANIRASIRRSKQSEIEAIMKAELKAKARKEGTLAKKISQQFEKERLAKERKVPPKVLPEIPPKARAKAERATVIDITKKSRNLAEKATRLQEKFEAGTISKSVYDSQKKAIMKQAKEIDSLRKDAIEVNKQAGKQPKARQFAQIEATPKTVTSAFAKAKAIAKEVIKPLAFVAAMTKAQTLAKAYEATKIEPIAIPAPIPEIKPTVKVPVTVKKPTIRKVPVAKPKVIKKKPTPKPVKPKEEIPFPKIVIPKMRPVKKKKPVKVVRKVVKEYSHFQIVNQIGGIQQIFG